MKRLMVGTAFVVFLLSAKSHAQSGVVIPPGNTGHKSQTGCVILKHMGRGDRTKSRLYSLGISGKQFRYIEGKLPEGFSFHSKLTDHDVRNLQAQGAKVIVLESDYTSEDLKEARAGCQGEASKTLIQAEAKAPPVPARGAIASIPASAPVTPTPKALSPKAPEMPAPRATLTKADDTGSSADTTEAALLDVSSSPAEADVYVDEQLSGRTPSTLILVPGDHTVVVKKRGFVVWQRRFKLSSGHTNVDAELVRKEK